MSIIAPSFPGSLLILFPLWTWKNWSVLHFGTLMSFCSCLDSISACLAFFNLILKYQAEKESSIPFR